MATSVRIPASDLRRLQFSRRLEGRDPIIPDKEAASTDGPAPYPFTRGIALLNDGVGYGERVVETVLILEKGSNVAKTETLTSWRTRTGKRKVPKTASLSELISSHDVGAAEVKPAETLPPEQAKVAGKLTTSASSVFDKGGAVALATLLAPASKRGTGADGDGE